MSLQRIDPSDNAFVINPNLGIDLLQRQPGPPQRVPGMTVGIVDMTTSAPHGGEMHPDGDELLYVFSGRVRITTDSDPDSALELGPGDACIVPKGEWHQVEVLEPVRLLHATPGPGGEHREI